MLDLQVSRGSAADKGKELALREPSENDPVLVNTFPLNLGSNDLVDPLRRHLHPELVFPRRHRSSRSRRHGEDVEPVEGTQGVEQKTGG